MTQPYFFSANRRCIFLTAVLISTHACAQNFGNAKKFGGVMLLVTMFDPFGFLSDRRME
jgi:hypothetical protein